MSCSLKRKKSVKSKDKGCFAVGAVAVKKCTEIADCIHEALRHAGLSPPSGRSTRSESEALIQ